ncbi:ATP synthase subunit delta [Candidatus Magnetomoraceae bacterium gMMP-15]
MKNLSIARRYAKALLILGKENGQAEIYGEELNDFAQLLADNKNLERTLINPLHSATGRRNVLTAVLKESQLSKEINSFLNLLFDKGRMGFLSSINDFYQKLADELKGVARASLISATELSSEAVEKIQTALSKMTGKEVVLEVEHDPGLIGGIITRIGDLILDGSIKTQLFNMKESLRRGESI